MKWIGRPLAEIWPFEIFPNVRLVGRSVGRQYILLLTPIFVLLFATLGTQRRGVKIWRDLIQFRQLIANISGM